MQHLVQNNIQMSGEGQDDPQTGEGESPSAVRNDGGSV